MSDFLTNLAARTLHAAPVVRPRLAARFESPSAGGRLFSDDSFGGEAETLLESTAPPPSPATAVSVARSESRDRADARRSDFAAPPADSTAGSPAARKQLAAGEPSRAPSPNETRPTAAPPILVQTIIERPAPEDRMPRSDARESAAAPSPNLPAAATPVVEKVLDRGLKLAARGAETPTVVALLPRVTPVSVSSPPSARRDLAPEPAPIIRVTIGRVEVRAISPPAPVPRRGTPARANSLLSLEEFLKQRTEGRK